MKNNKMCPKCQSTNIIRIDGYVGSHGAGNNVMLGMTIFSAVNVNRYICCDCGFTEEWIDKHSYAGMSFKYEVIDDEADN